MAFLTVEDLPNLHENQDMRDSAAQERVCSIVES